MTRVVEFKRGPTTYQIDSAVMFDIRMRMHDWHPSDLAEEMGVSVGCVYAIRSGRTKWPRGHTFFALLKALDIELRLYAVKEQRYL